MKCFRRCLSVLLCCLLLSTAFCLSVNAEEIDTKPIQIEQSVYLWNSTSSYDNLTFRPNNGTQEVNSYNTAYPISTNSDGWVTLDSKYIVTNADRSPIIKGGEKATVQLNNVYYSFLFRKNAGTSNLLQKYIRTPTSQRVLITYVDGSTLYVDDVSVSTASVREINLKFTFEPTQDVKSIEYQLEHWQIDSNYAGYMELFSYLGEVNVDAAYNLVIDQPSEEVGLLKSIIEWIKGIFSKLGDIWSAITELPSKLWSLIENGLKSLFVPSEDFIVNFKVRMDSLLSDRLGAVYQVIDITFGSWDRISSSDETNTIELPETTINLPNDNTFSFGGYDIQIVPTGFEFIVTILKTIVGIVCTVMFVNGLRSRYDEVMGVEK